jgi:cyclopropane fatty-acyl-phospholipid synthase-like methyltransferase
MSGDDVPSPIDFHELAQAKEWEAKTVKNRPWRPQFFTAFVTALNNYHGHAISALELGSGPGHLAEQVLKRCNVARYVALDFSEPMHELARARLGTAASKVEFLNRDFRSSDWSNGLGPFDAVITMQAAHEVRHTRHLPAFLAHARKCLTPNGLFLYCDHYARPQGHSDGYMNPDLYLRPDEQPIALQEAGFRKVQKLIDMGGMVLFAAVNSN